METLATKAIIYDSNCPMCSIYTSGFVKSGVLSKEGRIPFCQAGQSIMGKLDLQRARHEIPLVDTKTGEVMYGLDGLTLILSNIFPFTRSFITKPWFKAIFKPLYNFISYNRKVIAGSATSEGFDCTPDFKLKYRLPLIAIGLSYTAMSIGIVGMLIHVPSLLMLYAMVTAYFVLLLILNFIKHKTFEQRVDYVGHLATLGIIESTLFMSTTAIGFYAGLPGIVFAGQGAGRLFGLWLHSKRVENNGYDKSLDYAFAIGAVIMIVYMAMVAK